MSVLHQNTGPVRELTDTDALKMVAVQASSVGEFRFKITWLRTSPLCKGISEGFLQGNNLTACLSFSLSLSAVRLLVNKSESDLITTSGFGSWDPRALSALSVSVSALLCDCTPPSQVSLYFFAMQGNNPLKILIEQSYLGGPATSWALLHGGDWPLSYSSAGSIGHMVAKTT